VLSVKRLDDNNYRFNINIIQDQGFDLGEKSHFVETSKDLLMSWFEPQDGLKLHQMFSMIKNNKYVHDSFFILVSHVNSGELNTLVSHKK